MNRFLRPPTFLTLLVPYLLVLPLLAAAPGRAAAESHQVCTAYAQEAVQALQASQQLGCNLSGPRWQDNRQAHYDWCRGAPADWVANEARFRANQLRVCRREPGAEGCGRYATLAVAASEFNASGQCGFAGARWGGGYDHHLAWCLATPQAVSDRETAIRNAMVGVCNRNAEHLRCDAYARGAEAQVREAPKPMRDCSSACTNSMRRAGGPTVRLWQALRREGPPVRKSRGAPT